MTRYYFILFDDIIYGLDNPPELEYYPYFKDININNMDEAVDIVETRSLIALVPDTELTYFLQFINKDWENTVTTLCTMDPSDKAVLNITTHSIDNKLLL